VKGALERIAKSWACAKKGGTAESNFVPFEVEVFLFYKIIIAMKKKSSVKPFIREAVVGANGRKVNAKGALERYVESWAYAKKGGTAESNFVPFVG
jgi:hypothetical protein